MSLIMANTGGSTKRTSVNAIFFISYCVGNIVGPFAFKSAEAPVYQSGITAILVSYCVEVAVCVGYAVYSVRSNKRKAKELAQKGLENASDEEKAEMAFKDLTDIENPFFKYIY